MRISSNENDFISRNKNKIGDQGSHCKEQGMGFKPAL